MAMNKAGDVHVHGSADGPGTETEESGGHGPWGPDQDAEDGRGVPTPRPVATPRPAAAPMPPTIHRGGGTCSRHCCIALFARSPSAPCVPLTAQWIAPERWVCGNNQAPFLWPADCTLTTCDLCWQRDVYFCPIHGDNPCSMCGCREHSAPDCSATPTSSDCHVEGQLYMQCQMRRCQCCLS